MTSDRRDRHHRALELELASVSAIAIVSVPSDLVIAVVLAFEGPTEQGGRPTPRGDGYGPMSGDTDRFDASASKNSSVALPITPGLRNWRSEMTAAVLFLSARQRARGLHIPDHSSGGYVGVNDSIGTT